MLSGWLAILSVVAVMSFGCYYPGYVQRHNGCSVIKPYRMILLGGTEFFALTSEKSHPAYFMLVLALIVVIIVVLLLNKNDAKSWWHGIFMTLWQSLVFIALIYVFVVLSSSTKKGGKEK